MLGAMLLFKLQLITIREFHSKSKLIKNDLILIMMGTTQSAYLFNTYILATNCISYFDFLILCLHFFACYT